MHLRNLKKTKNNDNLIEEINESKQLDPADKQTDKNLNYEVKTYGVGQGNESRQFYSIQESQKTQRLSQQNSKNYSTNQLTQAKTISKMWNYNSALDYSTQAASPQYKFSTDIKGNQDAKSQIQQNSVKKKLFMEPQFQQKSPEFNLSGSKYESLMYTFKKKIDEYPKIFSEKGGEESQFESGRKISFARVNFSVKNEGSKERSKENDQMKLNTGVDGDRDENMKNVRKRLEFEEVSEDKNNEILKKIKEQIRRDRQTLEHEETDYKVSRRNQKDLIKKKILESRSDLKRFYEVESQNVEYQYRKAKFMDIFMGSRMLENSFR